MAAKEGGGFGFNGLPEGCIADVLAFTSPRDVCRLSSVSSIFRSAADSDAVWRRFLPADYQSIIARFPRLRRLSLKDLYFNLCTEPILVDGCKKSFSLDRSTGKKCYMLSARDLAIVWGDTPRYWRWTSVADPKPRFPEVATLVSVCWLEIRGKINLEMLSPSTRYGAYFVFTATEGAYGFEDQAVEVRLGLNGCEPTVRNVYLDSEPRQRPRQWRHEMIPRSFRPFGFLNPVRFIGTRMGSPEREDDDGAEYPKERSDKWWEVEIGEFVTGGAAEGEVKMSVLEVKGGNWKGGIVVHGVEVRPKVDDEGQ